MTQHHIAKTLPDGALQTYCGLNGFRAIGGGIEIGGKWSMATKSKTPTRDSCDACVKKLPAANKPPTIYAKLKEKLGREPSNAELFNAGLSWRQAGLDRQKRASRKRDVARIEADEKLARAGKGGKFHSVKSWIVAARRDPSKAALVKQYEDTFPYLKAKKRKKL